MRSRSTAKAIIMGQVRIHEVLTKRDVKKFVRFPFELYADDPNWVPPLLSAQVDRLDRRKNPFFKHARMRLWYAARDGVVVGTIAAIINERRNAALERRDGHFGFFECIDDPAVARTLLETAASWLEAEGMDTLRGPINLDDSEEVGVLVDGFDDPPVMLIGHGRKYYADLIRGLGFEKEYDVYAYELSMDDLEGSINGLPAKIRSAAERVFDDPSIRIRPIEMKEWNVEIERVYSVWKDAMIQPGFLDLPLTLSEFQKLAADLKLIVDPHLIYLAETRTDGRWEPIGFAITVPDANEILAKMNGRILPFGWLHLLRDRKRICRATFKVLAVKEEWRFRGIDGALIWRSAQAIAERGYERVDMSLISEKNVMMNRILARLGARIVKRYTVFNRPLPLESEQPNEIPPAATDAPG